MFVWTDPNRFSEKKEQERRPSGAGGLVSARWLALDAILRSMILDPEGPELRTMMRRDLQMMAASGKCEGALHDKANAYCQAVAVMDELKKTIS